MLAPSAWRREAPCVERLGTADPRRVVGPVAGRAHDSAKATEIEALGCRAVERLRLADLGLRQAALRHHRVNTRHEPAVALVPPRHRVREVVREPRLVGARAGKVPEQRDAHRAQRAQVEVVAAVPAGGEDVREQPGPPREASSRRPRGSPVSRSHQNRSRPPNRRGSHTARPQDRNTARPASWSSSAIWHPVCPLPTTGPGGRSAGDQVAGRVDLQQVRGQGRHRGRPVRSLVGAGGDHDVAGFDGASGRLHREAPSGPQLQPRDAHSLAHGRFDGGRARSTDCASIRIAPRAGAP